MSRRELGVVVLVVDAPPEFHLYHLSCKLNCFAKGGGGLDTFAKCSMDSDCESSVTGSSRTYSDEKHAACTHILKETGGADSRRGLRLSTLSQPREEPGAVLRVRVAAGVQPECDSSIVGELWTDIDTIAPHLVGLICALPDAKKNAEFAHALEERCTGAHEVDDQA